MSKKRFAEYVESLTDEQLKNCTGVGASIRELGKALEDRWQSVFGVRMDAGERKENGGKPNALADPKIDIEIPGVLCVLLRPSDEEGGKTRGHGYANDFGLSDKVKFAGVPPTLLIEQLADKFIGMLEGRIAKKAMNDFKKALRGCMTIDDGKFTFDKKKAPPLNHPVEVAELLADLRMEFVGTTNGATYVDMDVIPIPIDYTDADTQPVVCFTDTEPHSDIPSMAGPEDAQVITDAEEKSPSVVVEGTSPFFDKITQEGGFL